MLRKQVVSREEYDQSRFGLDAARAGRDAAQQQLDELLAGTRAEQLSAQRAAVAQLDAALASLDVDLEKSTLRAPYAGQVAERWVDEGTVVAPGQNVIRLVEDAVLEARVGVPPETAARLKPGARLLATVAGRSYPAEVEAVLPEVESATRTRGVVLRLADAAPELAPGQVARIELPERVQESGFWLPTTALTRGSRGLWACLATAPDAAGGTVVERREVEVLHTDGERALVRGALQDGERIVSAGVHRVTPGQAVTLAPPGSEMATLNAER